MAEEERDEGGESGDSGSSASQPPQSNPEPGPVKAAAWCRPLVRLDDAWTRWEGFLCASVLLLEVLVLSLWVGLKGLSTPPDAGSAGYVFRVLTGSAILGLIGFFAVRKKGKPAQRVASISGVVLGVIAASYWQNVGVAWSSNLLNWYQQASTLTLFGGLRGVGTRLTLLLALIGGSLATASGKHITIDLVTRFVKPKVRMPLVIVGWLGSAVICAGAGWGFFDHIAIENFGAEADVSASAKVSKVWKGLGEDSFIARKQMALDMKTLPKVLKGERYSEWLGGQEWNEFLETSGFVERYGREKIEDLKLEGDDKRSPIVVVPDRGEPRGELNKGANLVFPIGLFIIAIRFILLSLLALGGHRSVDPDTGTDGADVSKTHDADDLPAPGSEPGGAALDSEADDASDKEPDKQSGDKPPDSDDDEDEKEEEEEKEDEDEDEKEDGDQEPSAQASKASDEGADDKDDKPASDDDKDEGGSKQAAKSDPPKDDKDDDDSEKQASKDDDSKKQASKDTDKSDDEPEKQASKDDDKGEGKDDKADEGDKAAPAKQASKDDEEPDEDGWDTDDDKEEKKS